MYRSEGGDALHECENCGAALPAPDERGTRTCTFCKAVYTAPVAATPPPALSVMVGAPVGTPVAEFEPINPKTSRGCGGCLGWVILLVVVASIGVPLYFGLRGAGIDFGKIGKPTYRFLPASEVLPAGEPSAPISYVAINGRYDSGRSTTVYEVVRFNGTDGSPAWTSTTLPAGDEQMPMITDGTNVYVVGGTKLFALKLTDGSMAWQASLSDEYGGSYCTDCFSVLSSRVIVKTKDGDLQSFDAANGAPAWSRRLADVNARLVRTATKLVVFDTTSAASTLVTVDPTTGTDVATMEPLCLEPGDSPNFAQKLNFTSVLRAGAGDALYAFVGSSPSCIQSWDVSTGGLQWSVQADRTSWDAKVRILDTPLGTVLGDDNDLGVIDAEHTGYRVVTADDDLDYDPIGVVGSNAIVRVVSNRGTTKTSIRSIDLGTGATGWDHPMGKAKAIDGPEPSSSWSASSDGSFTSALDNGKVLIVLMDEGSSYDHKLMVESLDASTGAVIQNVTRDAGSHDLIPAFGPPTWVGSRLVTRVGDDTMQVIDATTGLTVQQAG